MSSWTHKKPTEPGFYFYHAPHEFDPNCVHIAQVSNVRDRSLGLFCSLASFMRGPLTIHRPIHEFKGKWAGPIPDPGPCL